MFRTIIVKPSYKALDVLRTTVSTESDVKILSPVAGKILTNSSLLSASAF